MADALLRFGVVTDCQYADIPTPPKSRRFYRQSPDKLREAVDTLNARGDLDFVIHLGDMVDKDFASYGVVMPIFRQLKFPRYQCLGNHDYSVEDAEKAKVPGALDMQANYYSFQRKGWRLIVTDGNEVSLFAHPAEHPQTALGKAVRASWNPQPAEWNGAVSQTQLSWLRDELDAAQAAGQHVLMFGHYPLLPRDSHNLWNASALLELVEEYRPLVKAFFCGHNHDGNYAAKHGAHFLNFMGMVDTKSNAFAVVEAQADVLRVTGYHREPHRELPLPAADFLP